MKWEDYLEIAFEKLNPEDAVNHLSEVNRVGTAEEIMDVIGFIGKDHRPATDKLLRMALLQDVKFAGYQILTLSDYCSSDLVQTAFHNSVAGFTKDDLEDFYFDLPKESILQIAETYHIPLPDCLLDEEPYESEETPEDNEERFNWETYIHHIFMYDDVKYAVQNIDRLERVGWGDEIADVISIILKEDHYGAANKLLRKAVDQNVQFESSQIAEIVDICSEDLVKSAFMNSANRYTQWDLTLLYNIVPDAWIYKAAESFQIPLPKYMEEDTEDDEEEEEEDVDDTWDEEADCDDLITCIYDALQASDIVAQTLIAAMNELDEAETYNLISMMNKNSVFGIYRRGSLLTADAAMQDVRLALEDFNRSIKQIYKHLSIQNDFGKLATVSNMLFSDSFLSVMTHRKINHAQKEIHSIAKRIDKAQRDLQYMLKNL